MEIGGQGGKITGIVWKPRAYESKPAAQKTAAGWLASRIYDYLEEWRTGKHNYQICLKLEDGTVISTGVTKLLMDRYVKSDPTLPSQEKKKVKKFVSQAVGLNLSGESESTLKSIGNLLAITKNLEFVRKFIELKLNTFDTVVGILAEDNDILKKILSFGDRDIYETFHALNSHREILKDRELLKRILDSGSSEPSRIIRLGQDPELLEFLVEDKDILKKMLSLTDEEIYKTIDTLNSHREIFKYRELLKRIIFRNDAVRILEALDKYPDLVKLDSKLLGTILDSYYNILHVIDNSPIIHFLQKIPFENAIKIVKLMEEIVLSKNYDKSLDKIVNYPEILELMGPDLMERTFHGLSLSKFDKILSAVVKNAEVLFKLDRSLLHSLIMRGGPDKLRFLSENLVLMELNPNLMNRILLGSNSVRIMQVFFEKCPEVLKRRDILMKYNEIFERLKGSVGDSDPILIAMVENPEVLEFIKPDLMERILPLSNSEEILSAIAKNPNILELIKPDLMERILHLKDADKILIAIGENAEVLEFIKPDLMKRILSLSNFDKILSAIAKNPNILELIKPDLMERILPLSNSEEILSAIAKNPNILELIKPDLMERILHLKDADKILIAIGENAEVLEFIKPDLMKRILSLSNFDKILSAIAKNPNILELIKPDLMERILPLSNSEEILSAIAKNPNILELIKPDLMERILHLKDADKILIAIGENAEVLEFIKPDLMKRILSLSNFDKILSAIAKNPNILELIKPDLMERIFHLKDADKILIAIGENPEVLFKLDPIILDKILATADAALKLRFLGRILELMELNPNLMNRILFGPESVRIMKVFEKYPEVLKRPDILMKYNEIYERLNGKVGDNFESIIFPYLLRRAEQFSSTSPGPFLNYTQFLYDVEFAKCNLPIRENDINDAQWKELREELEVKLLMLFPEDIHKQRLRDALRWFDQMPHTRDAQLGMQVIRKRVASIIDYLKKQEVDPKVLGDDALVDEGVEIAKELVRILAEGGEGTRCPDAAAAALEEAEVIAKAFTKREGSALRYIINVLVNEYKRNVIPAEFVDPRRRESVETQLYHLTLLNKPLGLESKTGTMLYAGIAIRTPLDEAMKVAYSVFSEEGLIGFAIDHPLMQAEFKTATDPKDLEDFKKLINDPEKGLGFFPSDNINKYIEKLQYFISVASSPEKLKELKTVIDVYYYTDKDEIFKTDPEKAAILDPLIEVQLVRLIDNFKEERTRILLQEAGFLSDTSDYEDLPDAYWQQ